MEKILKFLPWLGLILIGIAAYRTGVNTIRTQERLKMKEEEVKTLQHHIDSTLNNLKIYQEENSKKIDSLNERIKMISAESKKILTMVRADVDTFELVLPDHLKAGFNTIVVNYENIIRLKDIEINEWKEKERMAVVLDSLKSSTIASMDKQTKLITDAFKAAVKIARPNIFKRILGKADDVLLVVFVLIASK